MKSIQFTPTFVQTKNVRTFNSLMDGLLAGRGDRGDERLACVSGRAGRGKTRTVQTWAARNGAPYLPHGVDASSGDLNFIFRNDYNFPIRIQSHVQDGVLFIAFYRDDIRS